MRKKIVRNRTDVKGGGEFAECITSLHRAVHAVGLYFDRVLEGELTQAEAIVLLHLAPRGSATINDVHRAFLHKRSTLTSVVDRLERKGLVQRSIAQSDRRNFLLQLTPAGRRAAERVADAVAQLEQALAFTPAHTLSLSRSLEKTARAAARPDKEVA